MVAFETPIIQILTIPTGATSGQRIVIDGVAGSIIVYDSNNNIVGEWDSNGVMTFRNDTNTGMVRIEPSGEVGTGTFPGIYFFAANSSGAYANPAWIQANADSNNNPQLGFNSGPYLDSSGNHIARGRIFMADHQTIMQQIDTTTQVGIGGAFQSIDNGVTVSYTDPVSGTKVNTLNQSTLANATADVPVLIDAWHTVTYQNGWSYGGNGAADCQYRFDHSGYIHLRGCAGPGTRTDGTVIFTLPTNYRPPFVGFFPLAVSASANPTVLSRLIINPDGTVQVFGVASPVLTIFLSGIVFESNLYTA